MRTYHFTAVVEREGNGYTALCPELEIVSEGATLDEACRMLKEAVTLFFECAGTEEVSERTRKQCHIIPMECSIEQDR